MRLSATDKKVLITAIVKDENHFLFGRVSADTLEQKRKFNSLIKLKNAGLVEGKVEYQHQNGYQDPYFGRLWCNGKSWNEFSGQLTPRGIELAKSLLN
ncbi:hypothetical protein [Vibrio alginolyticus]|uniref:hypothetical protein n=1 Tax=Vibrio alginolyticus TaxID=663 RepID=UPI0015F451D6|nr:hypothetical protein [Vibrio alginolyticus]